MENIKKYKWLYLWIAAAGLIAFGALVLIIKDFGQNVVIFVSGLLLIIFVIIRFIPLIKTTRNKWAIVANAIEMFIDLVVGVLLIILTTRDGSSGDLNKVYPFILGGVLFLRGIVYLLEVSFWQTKPEVVKFLIHIAVLSVGVVIMARYDSFTVESFRWILGIAFCLAGGIATIDGGNNYGEYRKKYSNKNKDVKKKEEIVDTIEPEIGDPKNDIPSYIPPKEDNPNQDSDYVC